MRGGIRSAFSRTRVWLLRTTQTRAYLSERAKKESFMKIGLKSTLEFIVVALLFLISSACQSTNQPSAPSQITPATVAASPGDPLSATAGGRALAQGASSNGAAGQMPAYYEGQLFTVNMKEMPEDASASLIANSPSINEIYASNDLDEEQDFVPVIDAIQGEGF